MFVRADNRSFQQELAQEQDRAQEPATVEAATEGVPLTAEAIKSVTFASPAKRKHSTGSSVATLGSRDSRDMNMIFSDEPDPFFDDDDNGPQTSHQEFASPAPNKIGGLVEDLEKCRTEESDTSALGRRDATEPRAPEMQERGGQMPFITRPSSNETQKAPVDMMDMDIEAAHSP